MCLPFLSRLYFDELVLLQILLQHDLSIVQYLEN